VGREAPDGGRQLRSDEVDRRGPCRKPKAWPRGGGGESRDVVLGREIFLLGAAGDRSISFLFLFIF
jgi:hypothetical protein